jgi:hypothetical protein
MKKPTLKIWQIGAKLTGHKRLPMEPAPNSVAD